MIDRKFRSPRVWSNKELRKFSHRFSGNIVNVSAWKDIDKEGQRYRDYFSGADEYWMTNYNSVVKGFQGNLENEFFLDLSVRIDETLHDKYDVVFNHTVLEHIFEMGVAFENLCKLTKDIVILIAPFLQEQHTTYGDYWRFSPQAIDKLFLKNGLNTIYINYNDQRTSSIYVFAIGSKNPGKWSEIRNHKDNKLEEIYEVNIGTKIIRPSKYKQIAALSKKFFKF